MKHTEFVLKKIWDSKILQIIFWIIIGITILSLGIQLITVLLNAGGMFIHEFTTKPMVVADSNSQNTFFGTATDVLNEVSGGNGSAMWIIIFVMAVPILLNFRMIRRLFRTIY